MKKIVSGFITLYREFQSASLYSFIASFCSRMGIPVQGNTFQLKDGTTVLFEPKTLDRMVIRECFINNLYTKYLPTKKLSTVLDLGAHKGYFTLGLLHAGIQVEKIICVEPLPSNIKALQSNLNANPHLTHSASQIFLEKNAISTTIGKAKLYITSDSVSHSLHTPQAKIVRSQSVHTITLKYILRKYKIQSFDFIKIDIEGEEFPLFSSLEAKYILQAKYIAMEIHPRDNDKQSTIIARLKKSGFIIDLPNPVWPHLIFAHKR